MMLTKLSFLAWVCRYSRSLLQWHPRERPKSVTVREWLILCHCKQLNFTIRLEIGKSEKCHCNQMALYCVTVRTSNIPLGWCRGRRRSSRGWTSSWRRGRRSRRGWSSARRPGSGYRRAAAGRAWSDRTLQVLGLVRSSTTLKFRHLICRAVHLHWHL